MGSTMVSLTKTDLPSGVLPVTTLRTFMVPSDRLVGGLYARRQAEMEARMVRGRNEMVRE
jgi:hypothetical protein